MPATPERPIALFHEHPDWFRPLFAELERRGTPFVRIPAAEHGYDPEAEPAYSLVFNRMSPSAYLRGAGNAIFYTQSWLDWLERSGTRVVNGRAAYGVETSKAVQINLLRRLGLPHPRTRVINHPSQAPAAAEGLRYPIAVKPNIGGSGAGVRRFDTAAALEAASRDGLELGIDSVGLVQEFVPAQDGRIVRVEVLGGKFLYAIRIYTTGDTFDLCPADVCQRVEGSTPPDEIVAQVERIMAEAGIEVGGIEYFVDARDGKHYFYDVNALSNFVADAPRVVGFDPFERLADYLEAEAR